MSDNIIHIDETALKDELKNLVRNSVEKTLKELLNEEADRLVNAQRYDRNDDRRGYRPGHYDRNFTTTSGNVTLRVPKLKKSHLKRQLLKDTTAGKPLSKKR